MKTKFRNEHKAELIKELTKDGELAIADEYEQFVTTNYEALCQKYNTL